MGQRTEELTHDIERTRGELARDLDELQDKVSPSAIVERRKAAARQRWHGVRDKVMGTASSAGSSVQDSVSGTGQQAADAVRGAADATRGLGDSAGRQVEGSPLAAGLVAFGAGLVIASLLPSTDREARAAGRLVETAKEQAQPLVEEAKSVASDLGQDLSSAAADAAQQVKETATESATRVQEEGSSAAESVRDDVRG